MQFIGNMVKNIFSLFPDLFLVKIRIEFCRDKPVAGVRLHGKYGFRQSLKQDFALIRLLLLEEYRSRMISSKSSAACFGTFLRINKSSMTRRSDSEKSLVIFFLRLS